MIRDNHELIGWLYEVLKGLSWQVSVLDVLRTEEAYPGIMESLAVEHWQRELIKEQLAGQK